MRRYAGPRDHVGTIEADVRTTEQMTDDGGNMTSTPKTGDDVAPKTRRKTKRGRPWKVLLHNDDFTTMEFVIHILMKHFQKTGAEATHVMLQVHHKGIGVAGMYPRDVAETKVDVVTKEAQEAEMPLKVTAEPS